MISAELRRDGRGRLTGFLIRGHAGYAESGRDIVCAAVTAVAETALLGLRKVARVEVEVRRRPGLLVCRLPPAAAQGESAQAILETMACGLADIAADYGAHLEVRTTREE